MFNSRVFALARSLYKTNGVMRRSFTTTRTKLDVHHGAYSYRENPVAGKNWVLAADVMGGIMWWWIFWHLFTDYGHIIGEFEYPDAFAWTDAELGILPDDADD